MKCKNCIYNCKCKVYKTTQIQDIRNAMNITTDKEDIPDNLEIIYLKIEQDIPCVKKIVPVDWSIDGLVYSIYTKSGNLLMSDQLRKGAIYKMVYGNNPRHFLILNCCPVPKTCFNPSEDDEEDLLYRALDTASNESKKPANVNNKDKK